MYLDKITIDRKRCDSCHEAALIMAENPFLLWKMFLKR